MSRTASWVAGAVAVAVVAALIAQPRGVRESVDDRVVALMAEARLHFEEEGSASAALPLIDEAIALSPGELPLYHRKAEVLLASQRAEEALGVLAQARAIDPEAWPTYTLLMKVWGRLDQCDIAIAEVEDYLERHPDHARAHYARGFCHYKEGRWELALADVQRACELGHQPGCEMAESYGKPPQIRSVERTRIPD